MELPYEHFEPVASIDVGTNSVKCLVARARAGTISETLLDTAVTTRLGEGLGSSAILSEVAIERTARTVDELVVSAHRLGARRIRLTGTSAVREAANAGRLVDRVFNLCGVALEVLPGEEEARLSYHGAVGAADSRTAIVDVGGGSTEWAIGEGLHIVWRRSFRAGAVRFTEACFHSDPPSEHEVASAISSAEEGLHGLPAADGIPVVAVGGTARATALVAVSGSGSVEGFNLTLDELERQITLYASVNLIHRREIPGLPTSRADIVLAGTIILATAMRTAGVEAVRCTLRGLRHGVVLELAGP